MSKGKNPWSGFRKYRCKILRFSQIALELTSTLSNLVLGLPSQLQDLLKEIFESVDLIVVAGYSGTDYFDVNAWIRKRMNAKTKPRLLWIKHADECSDFGVNSSDKCY